MFRDREEAGAALAEAVAEAMAAGHPVDPLVLALPRGGVPVAAAVARRLRCPLDLVLVRKIGVPQQPELAAAAVVNGGRAEIVVNEPVASLTGMGGKLIEAIAKRELAEIERRRRVYLGGRAHEPIEGRTVILVDDGIATGTSLRAALQALRRHRARALVVAVPVAPADVLEALRTEVDEVICLDSPQPFIAIGEHYRDFHPLSDAEVVGLLRATGQQQVPEPAT